MAAEQTFVRASRLNGSNYLILMQTIDEKEASSFKHIKARMQKPYPIYNQNDPNQLTSIAYL